MGIGFATGCSWRKLGRSITAPSEVQVLAASFNGFWWTLVLGVVVLVVVVFVVVIFVVVAESTQVLATHSWNG